jgi:SOS-response transcriptional repressor LexA
MTPMTDGQRRVYEAIVKYEEQTGKRPTQRWLAEALGLSSSSNINVHMRKLEKAGWIKRDYYNTATVRT